MKVNWQVPDLKAVPATPLPSWNWPLNTYLYDRQSELRIEEQEELEIMLERIEAGFSSRRKATRQILHRLFQPIEDVLKLTEASRPISSRTILFMSREMHQRQRTFWAWSSEEWIETIGIEAGDFKKRHKHSCEARQYLAAIGYLLCDLKDFTALNRFNPYPFATKIFGKLYVDAAVKSVQEEILGWGYGTYREYRLTNALSVALLTNRSPHLAELSLEFLESLRAASMQTYLKQDLIPLSRALVSMGIISQPLAPLPPKLTHRPTYTAVDNVQAEWANWCQRWRDTSTLSPKTRKTLYYDLLTAGRWMHKAHPDIISPQQWNRELAAEYVAAVCRMKVGELSHTHRISVEKIGKPFKARAKAHLLGAVRVFFRDCQEWGWLECRFDPGRSFTTPLSVMTHIGPDPRVIQDDIWAKLLTAGLNLKMEDLSGPFPTNSPRQGSWYPLEMMKALVIVWLFCGLRSDEIYRLRMGCIRWQIPSGLLVNPNNGTGIELPKDVICLIDLPINKTSTAFTKPVDRIVGEAIMAWERVRPTQPALLDPKTAELVHFLFSYRAIRIGTGYLNEKVIPMLCSKAGVPQNDARGRITSHRARSTIASQLCNAKEPMSLLELQEWLGHRDPGATRHYLKSSPTKLAKSYADADYFKRNVRAIEVLIDQEVVKSGGAANGEAWKYYDLGHGYCTYDFFEQCPHRMACAKCMFYRPKGSSQVQILEAKSNLARMLQQMPLNEGERAAVEDGLTAMESLCIQLADLPTPEGPTPRELDQTKSKTRLPMLPKRTKLSL